MEFHEKIAKLTEDMVKSKVSKRASLPPTAISDYINKRYSPSGVVALRIARALGVSVEWLLDDSQGMPPVRADGVSPVTSAA